MQGQSFRSLPRVLVWAALALFTVYIGIRIVAGPGRDDELDVTWTGAAIAEVLAIVVVLGGLFARTAYVTYRREVAVGDGVLRISGARMNLFGEVFLTLVGGLLMLAATYLVLCIPESLLASNDPRFAGYARVSVGPNVMIGALFGGLGFVLMILRRYVWEARPGQPLRRYWARAFGRGHVVAQPVNVYWSHFYVKRGYQRVPVAHWLRAADPTSAGFFRDADLALVPLETPPHELAAIEDAWRVRFAQIALASPPLPRSAVAPASGVGIGLGT